MASAIYSPRSTTVTDGRLKAMVTATNPNTVLISTANKFDLHGNGGSHRTIQLVEIVRDLGLNVEPLTAGAVPGTVMRHVWGAYLCASYRFPMLPTRRRVSNGGYELALLTTGLRRHKGPRIVLSEAPNPILPRVAKRLGFAVVSAPQNLESLKIGAKDFYVGRGGWASISREIKELARCRAVFAISREEQWFLRLNHIDALYLPYFPPRAYVPELLAIREARRTTEKERFLVIGTADYPPTLASMRNHIELMARAGITRRHRIVVAGFGTERLKGVEPSVEVVGTLSQAELRSLLGTCRAVIAHDRPTTGALTRIPDFLVAGVPVVANENASRSAWRYSGVHSYCYMEELAALLDGELPTPELPERPKLEEQRFADLVKDLADQRVTGGRALG